MNAVCEAEEKDTAVHLRSSPRLTRAGFTAVWWSRLDRYCAGACACQTVEDLAAHVVLGDSVAAVWYSCMARGLCARRAGGTRVVRHLAWV